MQDNRFHPTPTVGPRTLEGRDAHDAPQTALGSVVNLDEAAWQPRMLVLDAKKAGLPA